MDFRCRHCGEPTDTDEFHFIAEEQDRTFEEVFNDFRQMGCPALGSRCDATAVAAMTPDGSALLGAAYDILGDDVDGAAAFMDDFYR